MNTPDSICAKREPKPTSPDLQRSFLRPCTAPWQTTTIPPPLSIKDSLNGALTISTLDGANIKFLEVAAREFRGIKPEKVNRHNRSDLA